MINPISRTEKRGRGRPRTDSTSIHLRLAPEDLSNLDGWRDAQADKPSRPEAIRRLVAQALAARALAEAAAEVALASQQLTILVVDDEELVGALTASMLEDVGHTVIEASSGARALEHLRTRPDIELMLTDYLMPGQTGVELARDAKRVRADLPILLMTGYADLAEGADGGLPRLAKPFRASELAARVDELVVERLPLALRQ